MRQPPPPDADDDLLWVEPEDRAADRAAEAPEPDDALEWVIEDEEEAPAGPTPAPAGHRLPESGDDDRDLPEDRAPKIAEPAEPAALVVGRRPEPLPAPEVSADAERAALLAAVLREEQLRSVVWRPRPRRRTPPAVRLAGGVLLIVATYLWLTPPAWLQPDLPPPVSAELQEASLRLGMYLQAQQIEAFRRRRGRLPDVLRETGEPVPGMYYRRMDARVYRLHGVTPRMALTYVSTDSLSTFISQAHRVVGVGLPR